MDLASRITRAPRPGHADRQAEALAATGATGPLADLIGGAAGGAPYLHGLILKEADWLAGAVDDPEAAFEALLGDPDLTLRRAKGRVALLTALCDLGGVWSLSDVTARLTRFADHACDTVLREALTTEIARGRLPGQTPDDIATGGGLAIIAMGKMGAHELNYSSDIDLICLYDETRFDPSDYADARASFVRIVRQMTKQLSERTAEGYVFRTDLRLRPDASVTPVAISMEAAERYYEAFGRTWERAAWIKARPCAGDVAAGARFIETLRPFVWRRHLDFAAIKDADDMRSRIREAKGLWDQDGLLGRNLKLGPGGIREIEFFTQTRQLISGGRDPDLRVPTTREGLTRLAGKGWIEGAMAEALSRHYVALREAEHRVQMVADQQTHLLPSKQADFAALAALAGEGAESYAAHLTRTLDDVAARIEAFYHPGADAPAPAEPSIDDDTRAIVERWHSYPALRSPRAVELFERMRPRLLDRLADCADPKAALVQFDGFLAGLPAGVQLFSLFEANPQLLDLIVDVADTAPALARHLGRNAGVFDAVIGGDFFAAWPGRAALTEELGKQLAALGDYEAQLDHARVWAREWHFRAGVHHLRGLATAAETARAYADLACAVVAALFPVVAAEFARKHGPAPGRGATVLAMGSLGAGRLTATSDLDLILIYDGAGVEGSDGPRPLATRPYYARLTQALVTALSAPTAVGRLYEVDLRLRPSGRQGPVATSWEAYQAYQAEEAWTWEHLALTRARPVAGDASLAADIETLRTAILTRPRDRAATIAAVAKMRARLFDAAGQGGPLNIRSGPGRVQDIELFAQTGALLAGETARDPDAQLAAALAAFGLGDADAARITAARDLYAPVRLALKLVGEPAQGLPPPGALAFVVREIGISDPETLPERLDEAAAQATDVIDRVIGRAEDAEIDQP